ncbi:MAG: hypothetical protein SF123_17705 [Chloroflexota bacterium]|nr:hypothetical protein [Chloroflexota bacterium]
MNRIQRLIVTGSLLALLLVTGSAFAQEAAEATQPASVPGAGIGVIIVGVGVVALVGIFLAFASQGEDEPKA